MLKKVFLFIFLGAGLVFPGLSPAQTAPCGRESFEAFVHFLGEGGAAAQQARSRFPMTEYYDENCRELTRQVNQDQIARWGALIPSAAQRAQDNCSLRTSVQGDIGRVSLIKDQSWEYAKLEFTWQGDCWYLTGFKISMDEPGSCR